MKIYLVGFMGVGKTYFGERLAKIFSLPFFDFDSIIQEQEKRTIASIFETDGEEYFRNLETNLLENFDNPGVIATGGGIIDKKANRMFLKNSGEIVLWLNPPWSIIKLRLSSAQQRNLRTRPKISQLDDEMLHKLWETRSLLYEEVSVITNMDGNIESMVTQIIDVRA
jgi:shikimate kinase